MVTVRIPLQLYADACLVARERGWTLSELIRDSLDRARHMAAADWRAEVVADDRRYAEWRQARLHPRRWAEQHRHVRVGDDPRSPPVASSAAERERDHEEAVTPSPIVVAAVRSAEIRRLQKARKR